MALTVHVCIDRQRRGPAARQQTGAETHELLHKRNPGHSLTPRGHCTFDSISPLSALEAVVSGLTSAAGSGC